MQELSAAATAGRVSLRTVLRTRLLVGYYCPLGARAATRCLAWLYCFCLANFLSILLIIGVIEQGFPLRDFWPILIEYNGQVLISLLTGENHFFKYLKGIEMIDREMGCYLPLTTPATVSICLIIFAEVTIIWVGGVFILNNYISKATIAMMTILIARNLNYLIMTLPLDLLRLRLRLVRQSLETNLNDSNLNNTDEKIKMLHMSLELYKKLLDNFNNTFNWAKLRITIGIFSCFYAFLMNGYSVIRSIVSDNYGTFGEGAAGWVPRGIDFVFNAAIPFLPAVFSELVSREYEQLKITVGNLILLCEDSEMLRELEMATNYLELRPFKLSILRVLVLDGSLVLGFFGICISYLIVIIQITGLI